MYLAKITREVTIPSMSEVMIPVRIPGKHTNHSVYLIEPVNSLAMTHHMLGARCTAHIENNRSVYRLLNLTQTHITLPQNQLIAKASMGLQGTILGRVRTMLLLILNIFQYNTYKPSRIEKYIRQRDYEYNQWIIGIQYAIMPKFIPGDNNKA